MIAQTSLRITDYILTSIALPLGALELNPLGFGFLSKIIISIWIIFCWITTFIFYKFNDNFLNRILFIVLSIFNTIMIIVIINNSINLIILLKR